MICIKRNTLFFQSLICWLLWYCSVVLRKQKHQSKQKPYLKTVAIICNDLPVNGLVIPSSHLQPGIHLYLALSLSQDLLHRLPVLGSEIEVVLQTRRPLQPALHEVRKTRLLLALYKAVSKIIIVLLKLQKNKPLQNLAYVFSCCKLQND